MDEIEKVVEGIGGVQEFYSEKLSLKQLKAIPYLAHGVPKSRVAEYVNIPISSLNKWLREEVEFVQAIERASQYVNSWHNQKLQEGIVRAWEVAFDILSYDYKTSDVQTRKEMARMVRFVLDSVNVDKSAQHITHEFVPPSMSNDEGTIDVIARRVHELENDDEEAVVDGDYRIDEVSDEFTCHPDTTFGNVNLNENNNTYQCHVCGKWIKDLFQHSDRVHGLSIGQYKKVFGIPESFEGVWSNE